MSEAINVCNVYVMKFGIWALTLYKVDSSNVLSIMPKNRFFIRLTLSLVKLVEMHPKKTHPGVN